MLLSFFLFISFLYLFLISHHIFLLLFSPSFQDDILPIHFAAKNGHLEMVRVLSECDPSTLSVRHKVSWYIFFGLLLCGVLLSFSAFVSFLFYLSFLIISSSLCFRVNLSLVISPFTSLSEKEFWSGSCSIGVWSFHCIC